MRSYHVRLITYYKTRSVMLSGT